MLGEEIPSGGQDTDTNFTESQIDKLLANAQNLYQAASAGWRKKAAKLIQKLGEISEYSVGQETYKKVNLQTAINIAQDMIRMYEDLDKKSKPATNTGSMILKITPPEVL
mgnify:CR=1 FL=1